MSGTVKASVIQHDVSGAPTVFRDGAGNEVGQLSKSWIGFDGGASTVFSSFNISSMTKTATGQYTVNLTRAMSDSLYSILSNGSNSGNGNSYMSLRGASNVITASSYMLTGCNGANAITDMTWAYASIFR